MYPSGSYPQQGNYMSSDLETIRSLTKIAGYILLIFGIIGIIIGFVLLLTSFFVAIISIFSGGAAFLTGILDIIISAILLYIAYNCITKIPLLIARANYISAKDKTLLYMILTFVFAILSFRNLIGIIYFIAAILLLVAYLKYDIVKQKDN